LLLSICLSVSSKLTQSNLKVFPMDLNKYISPEAARDS
jgi:hypothetical protein